MPDVFVASTTLQGQSRIREYVLAWLERLDYSGKLERSWPAEALGERIWHRVETEFAAVWDGPVTDNRMLAEIVAAAAVEDYYGAFPDRRGFRYVVHSPLGDAAFRRCALDFVHDLEEYEPAAMPTSPERAAELFWLDARSNPARWGCRADLGPLVDDESRAEEVVVETMREYYALKQQIREMNAR
jgi:hypothetical protein